MVREREPTDLPAPSLFDPRALDPNQEIVRRAGLGDHDIDQVMRVLHGLRNWREAERRMSEASRNYMRLGETDMRTLRFVIAAQNRGESVTPGAIANHLGITSASTSKMLDRLAKAGHVHRLPHPSDRRSITIEVSEETRRIALASVGRDHALKFHAAARLSPQEREIVTRFFNDLAATDR